MTEALFALHGSEGVIKRNASGAYKLVVGGLDRLHSWFANRPVHLQGTLSSKELVEGWNSYFGKNPPNSALSFRDQDGSFNRIVFEQFKPKLIRNRSILASKIRFLPLAAGESSATRGLKSDPLTGFKLQRGEKTLIKDPSVVIDDYDLSQVTFINNTSHDMKVDYIIGDVDEKTARILSVDLKKGATKTVAGTAHDKWDINAEVKVFDVSSWKTGLRVQADNPWYGKPQLEINATGSYYTSRDFDGQFSQQDTGKKGWAGKYPRPGEAWLLDKPAINFRFGNDNPEDKNEDKDWTFIFSDSSQPLA